MSSKAQIPDHLPSLLIPMGGRPWLIPNIVVAEVIPLRQPDHPGKGPEWLLGWINWREQKLPLISYEKLNGSQQVTIGPEARIAVINTVTGGTRFYAVVVQGIPRLLGVAQEDPVKEPGDTGPVESMYVQVGGDLAVIPDLDVIENTVMKLSQ